MTGTATGLGGALLRGGKGAGRVRCARCFGDTVRTEQCFDVGADPLLGPGVLAERAPGEERSAHHGDHGARQPSCAALHDLALFTSGFEQLRHFLFEGDVVAPCRHAELGIFEAELEEREQVGELLRFFCDLTNAVGDFGDRVKRR